MPRVKGHDCVYQPAAKFSSVGCRICYGSQHTVNCTDCDKYIDNIYCYMILFFVTYEGVTFSIFY